MTVTELSFRPQPCVLPDPDSEKRMQAGALQERSRTELFQRHREPTIFERFPHLLEDLRTQPPFDDFTKSQVMFDLGSLTYQEILSELRAQHFETRSLGNTIIQELIEEVDVIEAIYSTVFDIERVPFDKTLPMHAQRMFFIEDFERRLSNGLFLPRLVRFLRPEFREARIVEDLFQRLDWTTWIGGILPQFRVESELICRALKLAPPQRTPLTPPKDEIRTTLKALLSRIDQISEQERSSLFSATELSRSLLLSSIRREKEMYGLRQKETEKLQLYYQEAIEAFHIPPQPFPFSRSTPLSCQKMIERIVDDIWNRVSSFSLQQLIEPFEDTSLQRNPLLQRLQEKFCQTESFRAHVRESRKQLLALLPEPFAQMDEAFHPAEPQGTNICQVCQIALKALLKKVDLGELKEEHCVRLKEETPKNFLAWYLVRYIENRTACFLDDFRSRPYIPKVQLNILGEEMLAGGWVTDALGHVLDQERLASLLQAYTLKFQDLIELGLRGGGYIEKENFPDGTTVCVRGDLHSDLPTLFETLNFWQSEGKLDDHYRSVNNTHFYFLGDYTGRGINDIEVLLLLLSLKMNDPEHFHILRGNHEAKDIQLAFGQEKEFVEKYGDLFEKCYLSFPLTACIGSTPYQKGDHAKTEYMHLSHGAFALQVVLTPFLEGDAKRISLADIPHSLREDVPSVSPSKQEISARTIRDLMLTLFRYASEESSRTVSALNILWNDIQPVERLPTLRSQRPTDGRTYVAFGWEDIHAHARANSSNTVAIKGYLRGHEHLYREATVSRKKGGKKVLLTTLPVGCLGGSYAFCLNDPLQGLMLTVHPKVEHWEKRAVRLNREAPPGQPLFSRGSEIKHMYESLVSI